METRIRQNTIGVIALIIGIVFLFIAATIIESIGYGFLVTGLIVFIIGAIILLSNSMN